MKVISQLRESRGWSRAELARQTGLHPSQISHIESGRFRPYDGQLQKLARALEFSEVEAGKLLDEAV